MASLGDDGSAGDEDGLGGEDPFASVSQRTGPPLRAVVLDADDLVAVVGGVSSTYCASFSSPRWLDVKVSDGSGQVVPGAANSPIWATSDGDGSPGLDIDDDAFIAELLQSMGTQRREAEEQQCLDAASEPCDTDPVALIEDLLRDDGLDWRRVAVVGDPALSLQDAIDLLTEAGCPHKQPAQPSMPAPRDQPVSGRKRPCSAATSRRNDLFHKAPRRRSQGGSSRKAPPPRTDSSREATPTPSRGSRKPPLADSRGTSGADLDALRRIVPSLWDSANLSHATVLERSAQCCRELKEEHTQLDDQLAQLKQQVALLQQQTLAAQNDIPNEEARRDKLRRDSFEAWVETHSSRNCKFRLFTPLVAPLLPSFMASVSVSTESDLQRTMADWMHKHCSLTDLRHSVLTSLTLLCKSTSVLTNPDKLPQELAQAKSTWLLDDTNAAH